MRNILLLPLLAGTSFAQPRRERRIRAMGSGFPRIFDTRDLKVSNEETTNEEQSGGEKSISTGRCRSTVAEAIANVQGSFVLNPPRCCKHEGPTAALITHALWDKSTSTGFEPFWNDYYKLIDEYAKTADICFVMSGFNQTAANRFKKTLDEVLIQTNALVSLLPSVPAIMSTDPTNDMQLVNLFRVISETVGGPSIGVFNTGFAKLSQESVVTGQDRLPYVGSTDDNDYGIEAADITLQLLNGASPMALCFNGRPDLTYVGRRCASYYDVLTDGNPPSRYFGLTCRADSSVDALLALMVDEEVNAVFAHVDCCKSVAEAAERAKDEYNQTIIVGCQDNNDSAPRGSADFVTAQPVELQAVQVTSWSSSTSLTASETDPQLDPSPPFVLSSGSATAHNIAPINPESFDKSNGSQRSKGKGKIGTEKEGSANYGVVHVTSSFSGSTGGVTGTSIDKKTKEKKNDRGVASKGLTSKGGSKGYVKGGGSYSLSAKQLMKKDSKKGTKKKEVSSKTKKVSKSKAITRPPVSYPTPPPVVTTNRPTRKPVSGECSSSQSTYVLSRVPEAIAQNPNRCCNFDGPVFAIITHALLNSDTESGFDSFWNSIYLDIVRDANQFGLCFFMTGIDPTVASGRSISEIMITVNQIVSGISAVPAIMTTDPTDNPDLMTVVRGISVNPGLPSIGVFNTGYGNVVVESLVSGEDRLPFVGPTSDESYGQLAATATLRLLNNAPPTALCLSNGLNMTAMRCQEYYAGLTVSPPSSVSTDDLICNTSSTAADIRSLLSTSNANAVWATQECCEAVASAASRISGKLLVVGCMDVSPQDYQVDFVTTQPTRLQAHATSAWASCPVIQELKGRDGRKPEYFPSLRSLIKTTIKNVI
ncbi:hypothetical protein MPSEU_000433100 [Mayamaea pseudoterrestris]|nr:hypothetical protein MPSEU_000433100 [Mayamaea pseudoterrestris]